MFHFIKILLILLYVLKSLVISISLTKEKITDVFNYDLCHTMQ